MQNAFNAIDQDGSGAISKHELKTLLRRVDGVGADVSEDDVEAMMAYADADGNGEVDFEEFCKLKCLYDQAAMEMQEQVIDFKEDEEEQSPSEFKFLINGK